MCSFSVSSRNIWNYALECKLYITRCLKWIIDDLSWNIRESKINLTRLWDWVFIQLDTLHLMSLLNIISGLWIDKHKKKPNAHVTNERTNEFAYHKDDVYAKLSRRLFNVRVKICELRNLMQCLWVTTIRM